MKPAYFVTVAGLAIAIFCIGAIRPAYNWDIIGYVAAAFYKDGLRAEALSASTYAEVGREVPARLFDPISNGNIYRRALHEGDALEKQVPFYSVKLIYVEAIRALGKTGMSYARATYLLGASFAALSVVVLAFICLKARVSVFVLPLLVPAIGYVPLARLSTPDSFAVLGALSATLACMSGSVWLFPLVAVLPAIRSDYIVYSGLLMLLVFIRGARLRACLGAAAAACVYLAVGLSQHAYGWLTLLTFTFVKKSADPAQSAVPENFGRYLSVYAQAGWEMLGSSHFLIYLVCGYLLALYRRAILTRELFAGELLAVPAVFVGFHFLLFPSYQDRFFALPASLILLWLLGCLGSLYRTPNRA